MNAESQEEEYHFGEPETSPTNYSAAAAAVKGKSSFSKNKLLLVIVLATVIFALYKLLDILIFSRTTPAKPITHTTTVVPPPAPVQAPVAVTPAPVLAIPSRVEDKLRDLDQQTTTNQTAIDKLSSQMTDLQNTLTGLTERMTSLNDAVTAINSRLEAQAQAAAAAMERRRMRHVRVVPVPVYYVTAMVQGRAWLIGAGGRIITVRVGDDLPGYGTVRSIDPTQGVITLSTGAIIGYSPEDS